MRNPESQAPAPQLRHLAVRCRACLRCARACPAGAIATDEGRPRLDRRPCSACGGRECAAACPERALQASGREIPLDEVVARIAKDTDFYRNSGGGVTFSGGEPFAQAAFLLAALERCKELGIHTAVETCGHADPGDIAAAAPLVDLFLYDLKIADPARHRELTGADNSLAVENLRALAAIDASRIVVRVPIVPGFTDSPENIEAIAALAGEVGVAAVDLCPYHPFGRGKYAELGLPEPPDPPQPSPADLARIAAAFAARGVRCAVASPR